MRDSAQNRWSGFAAGSFQSVFQVTLVLSAVIVAVPGLGTLRWAPTVGLVGPVIVSLFLSNGDRIGGRRIILWAAAATGGGAACLGVGGFLAEAGMTAPGVVLAWIGLCLAPAALRLGELVVIALFRDASGRELVGGAISVRRWIVVGYYAYCIVAGVLALIPDGWPWMFVLYVPVLAGCAVALYRGLKDGTAPTAAGTHPVAVATSSAPAPCRERAATAPAVPKPPAALAQTGVRWAALTAFFARALPVMFTGGLPYALVDLGYHKVAAPWVAAAALLAFFLMGLKPTEHEKAFGQVAGLVTLAAPGLLVLALALRPAHSPPTLTWLLTLVCFGAAAIAYETGRQWGSVPVQLMARSGCRYWRDQGAQQIAGGLGQIPGTLLGQTAARHDVALWIGLLAAVGLIAWLIPALWVFLGTPGHGCPARHRGGRRRHRPRLVNRPGGLGREAQTQAERTGRAPGRRRPGPAYAGPGPRRASRATRMRRACVSVQAAEGAR